MNQRATGDIADVVIGSIRPQLCINHDSAGRISLQSWQGWVEFRAVEVMRQLAR